tara:strand:- start:100 stop:1221 length:1122 start_codon:yes stop_codon:yes gene_type:complete
MDTNDTKKVPKSSIVFSCKNCNYFTCRESQYERHILTLKHQKLNNDYKNDTNDTKKVPKSSIINSCECGKTYTHIQNLYRHKKNCIYIQKINNNSSDNDNDNDNDNNNDNVNDNVSNNFNDNVNDNVKEEKNGNKLLSSNDISKDLILKLVEENGEIKKLLFKQFESMQNQMQEQQKIMHNQISELIPRVGNNNTINNKQKFNINIFLNEQCKDAITMEEFINKIEITLGNLLVTKEKGLCEGVSNIFIENMNKLSLYERPMHCTDTKRETIYIKCEDEGGENGGVARWKKDEENKKLKLALNKVTHLQRKNLDMWVDKHPNWENISHQQDEYMLLVKNCTDDLKENNKENKIIRKVCNQIHITTNDECIDNN